MLGRKALSPDIERGALIVGGESFSFMIERSIHYRRFEPLLMPTFPSRLDRAFLMAVSQHVWDRAETAAWLGPALADLPGLPSKEIFYLVARNDGQVPNLSSELAVRSAGLPVLEGSVLEPWGTETVSSSYEGSAFIAFGLGDRDPPPGNVSPEVDDGGHGAAGLTEWGVQMTREFFATGVLTVPCEGPCVVTR